MKCPNCGADIVDSKAAFCPRCAAPLGGAEGEATSRIDTEAVRDAQERTSSGTTEMSTVDNEREDSGAAVPNIAPADEVRRVVATFGAREWADAAAAAGLSFLFLLCTGGVLLLAAKLQYPSFGSGADPIETMTAIVVLSLGILRVPIHLGKLTVFALPLGALMAVGWGIVWSVRGVMRRHLPESVRDRVIAGLRVGVIFGLICFLCALIFRFRGKDEVFAGAIGALVLGTFWASLFGALAGALERSSLRERIAEGAKAIRARSVLMFDGSYTALVALIVAIGLSAFAALVWIIVRLVASGTPAHFGAGDAVAALIYLVAFAPNVVIAIIALALGAPIDAGAQVTLGGRVIGSVQSYSIFGWGDQPAPTGAAVLLLIPLIACLAAGHWARRNASGKDERIVETIGLAAVVFGITMFVLAAISDARLGAGLVKQRGFGLIAPDPWWTLTLAVVWMAVVGFAGWKLIRHESDDV